VEAEVLSAGCAIKINSFIAGFDTLFLLVPVTTVSAGRSVQGDHPLRGSEGQELGLIEGFNTGWGG